MFVPHSHRSSLETWEAMQVAWVFAPDMWISHDYAFMLSECNFQRLLAIIIDLTEVFIFYDY